jgi:PAS domain S-box-containing protein
MFVSKDPATGSRSCRRLALLPLVVCLASAVAQAAPAGSGEPRRVLVLNSYHPGYQWTDGETRGVLATLGGSPKDLQVYVEYMGTKWASDATYLEQLRQAYTTKYQKLRFDVLVATDDDALRFLLQYRETVFGRVPTVFCGVNNFDPRQLEAHELYTGVNEIADFRGGLDLALRLHPGTRRIAAISDSSISGRKARAQLEEIVPEYARVLEFEFLGEGSVDAVLDRVAHLPPDSLAFHLVYFSDASGKIINNDETASLVSRASRVPVYGAWDFSLGHGIIGGKLLTGYDQGTAAGDMARRVLEGTPIADIPVVMTSVSRFMFDDDQLRRFGIRRSDLPPGSIVINAPPSFYALNKALVWGAGGTLAGLSGVVVMLLVSRARRRRAEQALRASEEKLRTLVENLRIGVFRCTADVPGHFLQVNPAIERIFRRPGAVIAEMPINDLFVDSNQHASLLETLRARGFVRDREVTLRGRDGTARTVAVTATAAGRDGSGAILWIDGTAEDVTDRKRMEVEIHRAQKLESLGLLAGGIAHDFNNLLTGILGNISFALQSGEGSADAGEALRDAGVASQRARALTQRLLTFAKGGAPVKRPLDVVGLVRASSGLALSGSRTACTVEAPDDLWPVEGDEVQLGQVLSNLILNADQAMPGGGTLVVRCQNALAGGAPPLPPPGRYVEIAVHDRGTGIAPEHLDKIFDPFFTTKERGRGLGLSTSYSIAKQHSGHITVTSEQGVGTTFTLHLPASSAPVEVVPASAPAAAPRAASRQGRILVMDDEESVRRTVQRMLRHLGYEVETAVDGKEAIARYAQELRGGTRFDAVIFDLTIPGGMGGAEAVREVLALDPRAKAIASSGYSNDPVMATHASYGFVCALGKPYELETLAAALQAVLG